MKKFGLLSSLAILLISFSITSYTTVIPVGNTASTIFNSPAEMPEDIEPQVKVVYSCPMHPEISQDKPGKCPKCGMDLVKKEVKTDMYSCPMHPEISQDKPGKCPKCGMNLVKKEVAKEEYTCPMHSDVIKDKPGKCPKCGMNLVLKQTSKK